MGKEINLIKNIIKEVDSNLYVDYIGNLKIKVTNELAELLLKLDMPEIRDYFNNYKEEQPKTNTKQVCEKIR